MVGTLTNQILWVHAGLHGSTQGLLLRGGGGKNQDFMLTRLFNPNDLIGCGGDINQSDSVGLCRSMWVYAEVYVGLHGGLF